MINFNIFLILKKLIKEIGNFFFGLFVDWAMENKVKYFRALTFSMRDYLYLDHIINQLFSSRPLNKNTQA